jgi:3-hydroxyisobutyrate dehydrogenase-like beta-hydroxyacid dehydrogenase
MEKITMIGLGAMGSVLAELMLKSGKKVTIWNRSGAKAAALTAQGAVYTPDIRAALAASPVAILCVLDYNVSAQLLEGIDLSGKTIIQLSTGTPEDARKMAASITERNALYLDGAILATPAQMGQPETPIFLSGSEAAYKAQEATLKILGGNLLYMGLAAGAASAWDIAVLSTMFGMTFGFFNGARIMETEGIPVSALGDTIAAISPVLGQMVQFTAHDIQRQHYSDPLSSLEICAASFDLMKRLAAEAGMRAPFVEFGLEEFNKARAAGMGSERLSAMMKVLR